MRSSIGLYFTFLCYLFSLSFAIRLPFYTRFNKSLPSRFVRRANLSTGAVPITNSHNAEYIANITLGGQKVPVLLDTGSSDLWVTGSIPQTQDTGKSASLSYAVGQAKGNINLASLTFDNYSVSDQAYLLVADTSTFSTDISAQGYNGLVGLGPNSGSVILKKLEQGSAGDTMLNRIFQQNMTTRNFISFLLSRAGDPGDPITGQLTISEVVPGYENISNYPQLSVQKVQGGSFTDADQHWQVLTDKNNGIIGPDGQVIQASSFVSHAPSGTLVAVIDSGFTFSQVPRKVSDAIYGRVQGAVYDSTDEIWTVPCDQILNISFNIGGSNFPIHPLDTVSSDFNTTGPQGQPLCLGTFQPITSAFSLLGEYDIILGMSFLRNAYTLLDYGEFVENSSNDQVKPYIQIMPITNSASAHQDFVKVRLNGVDNSNNPSKALLPPSQEQHSPESAHEKKLHYEARVLSHWPEILVGCLLFVIFLVGFVVWRCCCRRGKRRSKKTDSFIPMADNSPYAHLSGSHLGHGYNSTHHLAI